MVLTDFLSGAVDTLDRSRVDDAQDPEPGARFSLTHLAFGTLVDHVRGMDSASTREQVRQHLSCCLQCERAAKQMARLAEISRAEIDCGPPDDVVDQAIALFTSPSSSRQAVWDVSRLAVDPARRAAHAGEVEPGFRRRFLRFAAANGQVDVHLLVIEERVGISIAGQITAPTTGGPLDGEVTVRREPGQPPIAQARATPGGMFQLRYDAPAAALLHFIIPGVSAPIDVSIDFNTPPNKG
jgi:hypothetical protein